MARTAAYGGSYDFPSVSFDWLGGLPQTLEEGRIRAARQNLGDLQSLDEQAKYLAGQGDLEGAKTLYSLQTARRAQETAGIAAAAQAEYVKNLPEALKNMNKQLNPTAPGGPEYTPSFVQPAPVPGAMPVWPGDSGAPKPGAAVAPGVPVAQGPQGQIQIPANLPPEATRIGGAEQPALPQPTQVAGPPMVGGQSPVQPAPVAPQAPPQPGLDLRFGGTPPSPQAPVAPAARPAINPMADQEAAKREAQALEQVIAGAPKGAVNPALLARYRDALTRSDVKGERGDWAFAQAQNVMMGEPTKTFAQWQDDKQLLGKRFDEAVKTYGGVADEGKTALKVDDTLTKLDSLMKNEDFISGRGVATRNLVNQQIAGAIGIARSMGIPDHLLPDPKSIPGMSSTDVTLVFQGLARQLVVQSLGGLGRNISDKDVVYQDSTFPNLALTPEANRLLIEFHRQVAQQSIGAFNAAKAYRTQAEARNTFTQIGLDNALDKYYRENPPKSVIFNPDGTKTALGQKFDAQVVQQRAQAQGGGNPFAAAAQGANALASRAGQLLSGGPVPTGPLPPTEPMSGAPLAAAPRVVPPNIQSPALNDPMSGLSPTQAAPQAPIAAPAPAATPPVAGPGAAFQRPVPTSLPPGARRVIHEDGSRGIRLRDGRIIPVQ